MTENIGKLGPANTGGRVETASAPPPTLVDDINSLAAEIVAEARPQAPDSALPTPEATNTELEPAAAGTASPSAAADHRRGKSRKLPPPPSSQLAQKAFESQNSGNFPENESADQQIQEDITRTLTPVSDNERAAITENQLQAEPGNVEQNTNGAIMDKRCRHPRTRKMKLPSTRLGITLHRWIRTSSVSCPVSKGVDDGRRSRSRV